MNHGRTAGRGESLAIKIVCLVVALLLLITGHAPVVHAGNLPPNTLYLPILARADPFESTPAIWPHNQTPQAHEVALFRHRFNVSAGFTALQMQVFADTRYEIYLDGAFIGRGPARFSQWTHEYDVFSIPLLNAGEHVIAALVQWSPNTRRSESAQPVLQVRLKLGDQTVTQSDATWKASLSPAWKADAALVHSWQLIGATELLDLNKLPANWMQSGFDDSSWQSAIARPATSVRNQPRSIPQLAQVVMPATLFAGGLLAPGASLIELQPDAQGTVITTVDVNGSGQLKLQTLAQPDSLFSAQSDVLATSTAQQVLAPAQSPPMQVAVAGISLTWNIGDDWHPDYREASIALRGGRQEIIFRNVPAAGWPVLLSLNGAPVSNAPIAQGRHAGRRLLLAKPQATAGVVSFSSWAGSAMLTFNQPNSYAVLDLGRVVHGRIEATVQGKQGVVIDVGWDERLWKGAMPLPHPGSLHPQWDQADSWVLDGSSRRISTIDTRTGRYVLIAVWGDAPVQLSNVRVIEERYPVAQIAAPNFGDARLNAIWRVGRDTALINMTDAYADPWRERGQWWGDATVVDAVNAATFKDNALMRRGLLFMAEQFRETPSPAMAPHSAYAGHPLDYTMLWVQGVRNYVSRTGDTSILLDCYPAIKAFMAYVMTYQNADTGLLEMPQLGWWQTAFIDWAAVYNSAGSLSHGQSTPLNAMYYGTLVDAGALATLVNDPTQSAEWQQRAERVRDSINRVLYLPDQKRYASTIIGGNGVPPTVFAQAWPLAYGVTPAERQDDVVKALLELTSKDPARPSVQPYGMHWVLKALGNAGRIQEGLDLIKLYYGYMLDRGATTWWETFDADQDYTKALSHGWGSAPTWFLNQYATQFTAAMQPASQPIEKEKTE